jgi:hypothetical protein
MCSLNLWLLLCLNFESMTRPFIDYKAYKKCSQLDRLEDSLALTGAPIIPQFLKYSLGIFERETLRRLENRYWLGYSVLVAV